MGSSPLVQTTSPVLSGIWTVNPFFGDAVEVMLDTRFDNIPDLLLVRSKSVFSNVTFQQDSYGFDLRSAGPGSLVSSHGAKACVTPIVNCRIA